MSGTSFSLRHKQILTLQACFLNCSSIADTHLRNLLLHLLAFDHECICPYCAVSRDWISTRKFRKQENTLKALHIRLQARRLAIVNLSPTCGHCHWHQSLLINQWFRCMLTTVSYQGANTVLCASLIPAFSVVRYVLWRHLARTWQMTVVASEISVHVFAYAPISGAHDTQEASNEQLHEPVEELSIMW